MNMTIVDGVKKNQVMKKNQKYFSPAENDKEKYCSVPSTPLSKGGKQERKVLKIF